MFPKMAQNALVRKNMVTQKKIGKKLEEALHCAILEVKDVSEQHRGHKGYKEGGGTHFEVVVVSTDFFGLSRIKRHQKIYKILADELQAGVHALALTTLTPEEYADRPFA